MLQFHARASATKTDDSQDIQSKTKDIMQYVAGRIRENVDPASCQVSVKEDNSAIIVKWFAAHITADIEYTDESSAVLLSKFSSIGKPWESAIVLEHKDATQAYLELVTEISLESLLKNVETASKDADALESVVSEWITDTVGTLNPPGVTSAIIGILKKGDFIQEVDASLIEQECDV